VTARIYHASTNAGAVASALDWRQAYSSSCCLRCYPNVQNPTRYSILALRRSQLVLLIPLVAVGMRLASEPTANLSYLLITGYALKGRVQGLQALALSWLFSMLSPAIASQASMASIGRYGVLIAAASAMVIHKPAVPSVRTGKPLVQATLLLGSFFVVHALLFSSAADVSVLKAVSWTLAMTTAIAGWSCVSDRWRELVRKELFAGLVAVIVFSLPLLVMPAGYLVYRTGFQGIFSQPQAFGLTTALLGVWAVTRMITLRRPPWSLVLLVSLCFGLVVLSEARTAGLASVLGVAAAVAAAPAISGRPLLRLMPGLRSPRVQIVIGLSLVGLIVAWPFVAHRAETFIAKRSGAEGLINVYQISRGGLMEGMWANIKEHPWRGIGFGIASVPELMIVERDPILGLPIGVPIEKGVMPIAVLEEVGLPGLLFVATWLWIMLQRCARAGVGPLTVLFVILALNMGEFTFFSAGGMGLLEIILLAWAVTCDPVI
jgi:hypothetical protein